MEIKHSLPAEQPKYLRDVALALSTKRHSAATRLVGGEMEDGTFKGRVCRNSLEDALTS